ncbi:MAG: hypothetical protein CSA23_00275 [Deltaproteobacteria bacterium]|nr:MAG: hypothetical protein CSA23_00275 [Deltaproteobacteria bacterium]
MRKLSIFCLLLSFVLGLPGSAAAYAMFVEKSNAGPYGQDYPHWIYEDRDHKAWNTIDALLLSSLWSLAPITEQAEQDTIANLIFGTKNHEAYWLRDFQKSADNRLSAAGRQWATNEAWASTHRNVGEPNDGYGPGSEQYAAMWARTSIWNDEGALGHIIGFFVERSTPAPVPEPATLLLLGTGLIGISGWSRKRKTDRLENV